MTLFIVCSSLAPLFLGPQYDSWCNNVWILAQLSSMVGKCHVWCCILVRTYILYLMVHGALVGINVHLLFILFVSLSNSIHQDDGWPTQSHRLHPCHQRGEKKGTFVCIPTLFPTRQMKNSSEFKVPCLYPGRLWLYRSPLASIIK